MCVSTVFCLSVWRDVDRLGCVLGRLQVRVEDKTITVFVNGAKFMSAAMPKLNCPSNQFQLGIAGWNAPVAFRPVARPVALSRTSYECAEVAASKNFWYYSNLKGRAVGLLRNQPTNGGKDYGTAPGGWAACGGMVRIPLCRSACLAC